MKLTDVIRRPLITEKTSILREDGRLNELLIGESLELNLQQIPGITHVSSGAEALVLGVPGQSGDHIGSLFTRPDMGIALGLDD